MIGGSVERCYGCDRGEVLRHGCRIGRFDNADVVIPMEGGRGDSWIGVKDGAAVWVFLACGVNRARDGSWWCRRPVEKENRGTDGDLSASSEYPLSNNPRGLLYRPRNFEKHEKERSARSILRRSPDSKATYSFVIITIFIQARYKHGYIHAPGLLEDGRRRKEKSESSGPWI
ncbi:hypothetical protein K445DRAFT_138260 [Daldinia sp. EC12]|nr:hypothetical protein K445DRAFT_138260 [Daldinia sp. EC12]